MMDRAESSVLRELDLVRFIKMQRFTKYASLALLRGHQRFMADKMSTLVMREASELELKSSEDLEYEDKLVSVANLSSMIVDSKNAVDKRLVGLFAMNHGLLQAEAIKDAPLIEIEQVDQPSSSALI